MSSLFENIVNAVAQLPSKNKLWLDSFIVCVFLINTIYKKKIHQHYFPLGLKQWLSVWV